MLLSGENYVIMVFMNWDICKNLRTYLFSFRIKQKLPILISLFNMYLLGTYYILGTMMKVGYTAVNEMD